MGMLDELKKIAESKTAKVLTENARAHVSKKNFAMPASAAESGKGNKGSYPINDKAHARSALSYGSRFLSPGQYSQLKSRVHAKYPNMGKESSLDITTRIENVDALIKEAKFNPILKKILILLGVGAGAYAFGRSAHDTTYTSNGQVTVTEALPEKIRSRPILRKA
jgi:hypothetical protein